MLPKTIYFKRKHQWNTAYLNIEKTFNYNEINLDSFWFLWESEFILWGFAWDLPGYYNVYRSWYHIGLNLEAATGGVL